MFIGLIILIFTYNPTVPASDPNDCLNDEPIAEPDDKYWCVYDHPAPGPAEPEDELEPEDDDDIDDGWIYDDERNMWIDPCDQDDTIPEYDRRAAQAEIEKEWKRT